MLQNNSLYVYIGTYTGNLPHVEGKAKGIYVYRLDPETGALTYASQNDAGVNPSYVTTDAAKRFLYAVDEHHIFEDGSGAVSAYSIDPATKALTFLNRQLTHGAWPCHLSLDNTGKYLLSANYISGNVAVLPIRDDGTLGEASDVVQHYGYSVHPKRQQEPHAHQILTDASNRYAFVPDLGLDKIMIYEFDSEYGKLKPASQAGAELHAGAGPRHFAFHTSGKYAYVISELDSTITGFSYEDGKLEPIQTISTLPDHFFGNSSTAAIKVHPSGKFVYGSNRWHDTIAIFACDEAMGKLTAIGYEPTQGAAPRDFDLDPSGTIMLVANQDTDTIVSYHIDSNTGLLNPTGQVTEIATPVCVHIVEFPPV